MAGSASEIYISLFHDRLKNVLMQQCDIQILPILVIKKRQPKIYQDIKKVTSFLYIISERWNTDKSRTRNFTIGVFHLYCKLVVGYLRQNRVPVSLKTSLQHTEKFVGLVDLAFPGYVENGVIKIVILGEKGRRNGLEI